MRRAAIAALAVVLGACAKSPGELRGELTDYDPYVRWCAALALAEGEPRGAQPALPVLFRRMQDVPEDVALAERAVLRVAAARPSALVSMWIREGPRNGHIERIAGPWLDGLGPAAVRPIVVALERAGWAEDEGLTERLRALLARDASAVAALAEVAARADDARRPRLAELVRDLPPVRAQLRALSAEGDAGAAALEAAFGAAGEGRGDG